MESDKLFDDLLKEVRSSYKKLRSNTTKTVFYVYLGNLIKKLNYTRREIRKDLSQLNSKQKKTNLNSVLRKLSKLDQKERKQRIDNVFRRKRNGI